MKKRHLDELVIGASFEDLFKFDLRIGLSLLLLLVLGDGGGRAWVNIVQAEHRLRRRITFPEDPF